MRLEGLRGFLLAGRPFRRHTHDALSVALFLLCAPALANPFRILVLDDPLQNMDGMTVSALARGLGKLVRVFPDG